MATDRHRCGCGIDCFVSDFLVRWQADSGGDGLGQLTVGEALACWPGSRWIILNDVRAPLRALKPRLGKCDAEGSEWGVSTTPEPVASSKDVDAWVDQLEKQWTDKGYDVSVKKEKTITLD